MIGVDAGGRQAKALDRTAVDQVLLYDLLGVARVGEPIPHGLGVDDEYSGVFALIEAAGFINADTMLETGGFDGVLERAAKFLAVFVGAAWARGRFVPLIHADKKVVFIDRHIDFGCRKISKEATVGWDSATI